MHFFYLQVATLPLRPAFLRLLENCPRGAETLLTRLVHIFTEKCMYFMYAFFFTAPGPFSGCRVPSGRPVFLINIIFDICDIIFYPECNICHSLALNYLCARIHAKPLIHFGVKECHNMRTFILSFHPG